MASAVEAAEAVEAAAEEKKRPHEIVAEPCATYSKEGVSL